MGPRGAWKGVDEGVVMEGGMGLGVRGLGG